MKFMFGHTAEKEDDAIHQLVYMSKAKSSQFNQAELDRILKISRRNNTKRGVTGMLLYHNGTFLQILEGPEPTVEAIYQTIKYDPRHVGLQTIAKRTLRKRDFPDWSMSFRNLDAEENKKEQAGFNTFLSAYNPSRLNEDMSTEVQKLLSKFRTIWVESEA